MHSLPVNIKSKQLFHSIHGIVSRNLLGSAHNLILSILASLFVMGIQYRFDHHEEIRQDSPGKQIVLFNETIGNAKTKQQNSRPRIEPGILPMDATVNSATTSSVERRKRVIAYRGFFPRSRRNSSYEGGDDASERRRSPPQVVLADNAPFMPRLAIPNAAASAPPASFITATERPYSQSEDAFRPLSQGLKVAASAGALALKVNSLMISRFEDASDQLPDSK